MGLEAAECKTCEYCAYRNLRTCIHTNENQLSVTREKLNGVWSYYWQWSTCDKWVQRQCE